MYDEMHVHIPHKIPFDIVDLVVRFDKVFATVNLDVNRRISYRRAVTVNHKVVETQNLVVLPEFFGDFRDKFLVGHSAEKRIYRFFQKFYAENNNDHRHDKPRLSVDIYARNVDDNRRNQDGNRRKHVVSAVCGRRLQRLGIDCFAEVPVNQPLQNLQDYRNGKHDVGVRRNIDAFGRNDFFNALLQQQHTDKHDRKRNDKRRDVFVPGVSERVFPVGRSVGKFEPENGNDG